MLLQQKVRLTISDAGTYALGIVGEIDHTILHTLEISGLCILFIKHSILPACPGSSA